MKTRNNMKESKVCRATSVQALSKRIHYGKFVAEAKFLAAEDEYRALIEAQDAEAIMEALTDRAVEQKACRSPTWSGLRLWHLSALLTPP